MSQTVNVGLFVEEDEGAVFDNKAEMDDYYYGDDPDEMPDGIPCVILYSDN